jgi:hypothetical protein
MFADASSLFRQIHPSWVQEGDITSQAFTPTKKDRRRLSSYDGTMITAKDSYYHYTADLAQASVGVMAITPQECKDHGLLVSADPLLNFDSHVVIVFPDELTKSGTKNKAKYLKEIATRRGWQFKPDSEVSERD